VVTNSCYVDSSVILSKILKQNSPALDFSHYQEVYTSQILDIECRRVLDRIRVHDKLSEESLAEKIEELDFFLESATVILLSSLVLRRAKGAFPTVIGTLDALHLATAELIGVRTFFTMDKQQKIAARALGMLVE